MKIAHLSDPHILDLQGVPVTRLLASKRFTGWVNLKLHRGSVHKLQVVEAMLDDIRALAPDHVVVTGDLTNLALETEFALAQKTFASLGMPSDAISIIPGNHDVYTGGAERSQRFMSYFAPNATSDLPVGVSHRSGRFPFVRLRGAVAIIGLSTAVARLPLFAHGHAGDDQIRALTEILAHPEVKQRTPVVLVHHPLIDPPKALRAWMHGLPDAPALRSALAATPRGVVLHGHIHQRHRRTLSPGVELISATSASLLDPRGDRMAGYNVYDFDDATGALQRVTAHVYQPDHGRFEAQPLALDA